MSHKALQEFQIFLLFQLIQFHAESQEACDHQIIHIEVRFHLMLVPLERDKIFLNHLDN